MKAHPPSFYRFCAVLKENNVKWLAAFMALSLLATPVFADEIRVAVASNFGETIKHLSKDFEESTSHKIKLIFGATGRHYAQIINGAPFDIYFAADVKRPKLLEDDGVAIKNSRFTYAWGKLVLWSPDKNLVDDKAAVLEHANFNYLSIANPKLAPYGKAAYEFLLARNLWKPDLLRKTVRGENIGQAFQFVRSENTELGFVAYSQVKRPNEALKGSLWEVPESLYSPIEQQAVLLNDGAASRAFLCFIQSKAAKKLIQNYGYKTKDAPEKVRTALQCEEN